MGELKIPLYQCRRNDLVWARDADDGRRTWNRVLRVDHEPGHPVRLDLCDGSHVVGDALDLVGVRRLELLHGGARLSDG